MSAYLICMVRVDDPACRQLDGTEGLLASGYKADGTDYPWHPPGSQD